MQNRNQHEKNSIRSHYNREHYFSGKRIGNRRSGDQRFISRNAMGIMTICALVIVIFMPEIVGLLESVK
tara:strand:+ start:81 stop:287 length:207 start_codon:yes stop_codon:yes gene_type:complete